MKEELEEKLTLKSINEHLMAFERKTMTMFEDLIQRIESPKQNEKEPQPEFNVNEILKVIDDLTEKSKRISDSINYIREVSVIETNHEIKKNKNEYFKEKMRIHKKFTEKEKKENK